MCISLNGAGGYMRVPTPLLWHKTIGVFKKTKVDDEREMDTASTEVLFLFLFLYTWLDIVKWLLRKLMNWSIAKMYHIVWKASYLHTIYKGNIICFYIVNRRFCPVSSKSRIFSRYQDVKLLMKTHLNIFSCNVVRGAALLNPSRFEIINATCAACCW